VAVVDQPVNHGGGEFVIAKDSVPLGKLQIRRDDQALLLVTLRNDLKQQFTGFLMKRNEPNLVQHKQFYPPQ
jgi:hypothetical protein